MCLAAPAGGAIGTTAIVVMAVSAGPAASYLRLLLLLLKHFLLADGQLAGHLDVDHLMLLRVL